MKYSYQLRGTNGSGKTHVARHLMKESKAEPTIRNHKGKVLVYEGELDGYPIEFLGSYETQCGGCDTIPSVAYVAQLLEERMNVGDRGIVFFEGLMISHMLGTVGKMQAKLGKDRNFLAFLDTPLEKCIEHVVARRMFRKDDRPFDPKNVIKDHPRVHQSRENAIKQGYRVVDVPWQDSCLTVRTHLTHMITLTTGK